MKRATTLVLICALLLSACATTPTQPRPATPSKPANIKEWMALQSRAKKRAIAGFLVGAALGAASAGLSGGNRDDIVRHALAGGVVGAMAGFAIGRHEDKIFAGRDLAVRQTGYDASQGYLARVEEVRFDPAQPKPGDTATLYVRYVVIGPNPNEAIKVRMFRGLKHGDDYVVGAGPNEFTVTQGGGVVESKMEVTLPKKAEQGDYSVEALLEDANGRFPQAIGTGALSIVAQAVAKRSFLMAAR